MCSDLDQRVFDAKSVAAGDPERCPRCAYPIDGADGCRGEHPNLGLTEAGFCQNPFSCIAGRNPWRYQTELSHGSCDACSGIKAPLAPADRLWEYIESCPVCLTLHGLPQRRSRGPSGGDAGYEIETFTIAKVLAFMTTKVVVNGNELHHFEAIRLSTACPICGVHRGEMMRFLLQEFLVHGGTKEDLVMPTVRPSNALDNAGVAKSNSDAMQSAPSDTPSRQRDGSIGTVDEAKPEGRTDGDPVTVLVRALNPPQGALDLDAERLLEALKQFHQQLDAKSVRTSLMSDGFTGLEEYQRLCSSIRRIFDSRVFGGQRLIDRVNEVENLFRGREPHRLDPYTF
jgi:hypothetical protein